jgi:hypothetical protein
MPFKNKELKNAYARAWKAKNLEKENARHRRYRENNKERIRNNHRIRYQDPKHRDYLLGLNRLKITGWTREEYQNALVSQNGVCALCKKTSKKRLSADHCHKTGMKRALLCTVCNLGLGAFKDNPELLRLAALYIEFFAQRERING